MKHLIRKMILAVATIVLSFSSQAQQTFIIGPTTGTTGSSYFYGPIYRSSATSSFNYSRYAYIYTAAELGLAPGSSISQIDWHKISGTLTGNNTFDVYLGNTSATSLSDGTSFSSLQALTTKVYGLPKAFSVASGWEGVTLPSAFVYTGGSILVLVDHVKVGTASAAMLFNTSAAVGKAIGWASSAPITSNLSSISYGNNRPTVRFTATQPPCSGAPEEGIVTSSLSSICDNSVLLELQNVLSYPSYTYQWQSSAIATSGFTNISSATSRTLTTTQPGSRYYRCVVTCAGSGLSTNSSPTFVSSTPVAGTATSTQEIVCSPTSTFVLGLTNNIASTGLTYQWQSSATENGTYSDIVGATATAYTGTQAASTFYRCKVSCPSAITVEYSTPVQVLYGGTVPAGTYTVGTGGNYASLNEVRLALQCGVAGAVTFNILPGTYTQSLTFGEISGTSASAKITFQKAPNTIGSVTITHPTATNLFLLNGTDNVTFRDINFVGPNRIVAYTGSCENLSFYGNSFTGTNGLSTDLNASAVISIGTANALGTWKFNNNTVQDLAGGFYLVSTLPLVITAPWKPDSVQFISNNFEVGSGGIYVSHAMDARAINNTISSKNSTALPTSSAEKNYGIYCINIDSNATALNNSIVGNFYLGIDLRTRGPVQAVTNPAGTAPIPISSPTIVIRGNTVNSRLQGIYGVISPVTSSSLAPGPTTTPAQAARIDGTLIISSNNVNMTGSTTSATFGIWAYAQYQAAYSFVRVDTNTVIGVNTAEGITINMTNIGRLNYVNTRGVGGSVAFNSINLDQSNSFTTTAGLYFNTTRFGVPFLVSNNVVLVNNRTTTGNTRTVYFQNSDNIKFYNNTVWCKGGGASVARALYVNNLLFTPSTSTTTGASGGLGNDIQNNLIIKDDQGYVFELDNTVNPPSSNNNTFFGTTATPFRRAGSNSPTLSAWTTATSLDVNSNFGDPVINSFADPRVQGLAVSNNGAALGIAKDFFGTTRSVTTPDRGIHEFNYSACFLAVGPSVVQRNINSLVLSWSSKNTAKIGTQFRFRKLGQTAWAYQSVSGTVTSSVLNGLQANSAYEIGIREICSAQDTGQWGNEFVYGSTLCAFSSSMPVTVNFNSSLSACINNGAAGGSSAWDIVTTDQFGPAAATDGSQFARVDQSDATSNNPYYFELRPVAMPTDRKQFNLDYYVGSKWTAAPPVGNATSFSTSGGSTPFFTNWMDQRAAYLLLASELTAAGYLPGNISGLSLTVGTPNVPAENFSISAATTSLSSLSTSATLPTLTSVYSNPSYQPTVGVNTFPFTNSLVWNGTDNILIVTCYDRSTYVTSSSVAVSTTPFTSVLYKYADISAGNLCSDAFTTTATSRPVFGLVGLPAAYNSPIELEASIDDGDNWTSIFSVSQTQAVANANIWATAEIDLNTYKDESVRLRVKGRTSGAGGTTSGVAIDNLSITDFNACKRPVNLALSTTTYLNPLNTSVELDWNAGISNETQWELTYGAAGHTPGTGTTVTVSTTPAKKLTGLTQGTTYDIYVRATCGANTYSAWVGPLRTTTACVVPAVSSLENFDGANWTSTSVSNCWSLDPRSTTTTTYGWKVGTGGTPTSTTGPNAASSPSKYLFVEADGGTTGAEAILRAPFVSTVGINYPEVTFDYHMYGSGMGKLFVDVSLDSGETWMAKDSIVGQQQGSRSAAWRTKSTGLYGFGDKSLMLVRLRYKRGSSTAGDVAIDNFEVRNGCALDLSGTLTANPSCNGDADGAIVAQVENANGPVLYRLGTTGAFDTIVEFNNLAAGAYTLYARDSFNCETSTVITLTEPAVISATATIANATCFGGASGTIGLIPTGGTAPYTYVWSNAMDTTFMETSRNVDSLRAGTYVVDITDARGCTYSATYAVGQRPEIVATTVSRSTVSCIAQDGAIVLAISGGTGAKTVVWNTTPVQTGLTATGLSVGFYTATITDANGCVVTYTEQVLPADTVGSAVSGKTNVSCWGQANGAATLNGVGGQAPYTFVWSTNPPQTTQTAVNLLPGTYTGIVTDAKGCTSSKTVVIGYADVTAPVLVTKTATISLNAAGAAVLVASNVILSATDACGVITTTLSKTNFSCADLGANTVQVTVTDGVGNTTTLPAVVTVVDNILPMFNTAGSPITLNLSATGNATLTAAQALSMISDNCGVPTITFSKTAFNCSDRGMNTVTVTATDASGNAATRTIQVMVVDNTAPAITLNSAPITVVLNASGTGTITLGQVGSATDNCGAPTVTLSNASFSCANRGVNQVVLTATDASGNISTAVKAVTVVDNASPVLTATPSNVVVGSCNAVVNYSYSATDNCGYTVTRTAGLASGSTFPVGVTTVTHAFADASGNTVNHSFTVTVVNGAPTLPTLGAYCPTDAVVNLTGGQAGLVFAGPGVVNGTQFNPALAAVGQNSLSYSFTDANGCLHTGSVLATVNAAPAKPNVALVSPTLLDAQGVQASSYQWFYSGNAIAGGTSKTQAVVGYGVYEVEVGNALGCTTRSNGLDYGSNGLGMINLIQGLINIMPVPAVDFVTISNQSGLDIEHVVMYSINGQVVKEINNSALQNDIVVSVADLPSGLYFFAIHVVGEHVIMKRVEKI